MHSSEAIPVNSTTESQAFQIVNVAELTPVECPCGETRRAFVEDLNGVASLHVVDISVSARTHYHKRLTEIYYILQGEGHIELDGEIHTVRPGDAILIKPGCRHRAIGRMKVLNVPIPAYDIDDEWFD
jgi:mannose-6-phosphate isomerase-like protein (cupin superfamily)